MLFKVFVRVTRTYSRVGIITEGFTSRAELAVLALFFGLCFSFSGLKEYLKSKADKRNFSEVTAIVIKKLEPITIKTGRFGQDKLIFPCYQVKFNYRDKEMTAEIGIDRDYAEGDKLIIYYDTSGKQKPRVSAPDTSRIGISLFLGGLGIILCLIGLIILGLFLFDKL